MLEKFRIWRRINWKHYSKENTEIRETFLVPEHVLDESLLLYYNIVDIARLVFCRPWIPHTPLQDDGDKPMRDLTQNLQTLGVHALADMQTSCVRTQTWYEHVAVSICADEEVLTVAQRPTWYSDTYPERETGTETDSYQ